MKKIILPLFLAPLFGFGQTLDANAFYNKGANVYVQQGALLHIQGTLTNDNAGNMYTDGVIELKGDIDNTNGAIFKPNSPNAGTEKAVKFIGNGTQAIKGLFNDAGTSSFYNLIVDKGASPSAVELQESILVEGSLVFGSATTANTYTPTAVSQMTNNNGKGVIRTYDGLGTDYELFVSNPAQNAISGYPNLQMNRNIAINDAYVQTRGERMVGLGGLKRNVNYTGSAPDHTYEFPIGTADKGFQAVRFKFESINGNADNVRGMFCNGSSNPNGQVGHVSQFCIGCPPGAQPDNLGINIIFGSPYAGSDPNPCATPQKPQQWVILEDGIKNHGYWSFAAGNNSPNTTYSLETFPTNFEDQGMVEPFYSEETWRTMVLHDNHVPMNGDPSAAGVDWNADLFAISDMSDLVTYTRNTTCYPYTNPGVPGGVYAGFSHFAIKKSKSNNALPVELIYLKAEPVNNEFIQVSWATAVEINNRGFEVMRSTDGVNFTNVGWVDGNNNSTLTQTYSFDDHNVVPNVIYYYKLNQIDNDGHNEETYIVNAMITSGEVFTVSEFIPNPAKDLSRIIVNTTLAQSVDVKLYDMLGRELSQYKHNLSAGENALYFDTNILADATYTAVITAGNKVYSKKLVVSKY